MRRAIAVAFALSGLSAAVASAQVPAGGEFRVNTVTTDYQYASSVVSAAAGNFVVFWADDRAQSLAQRYDAAGVPLGAEFLDGYFSSPWDTPARVASDAAGRLVVAHATNYAIYGHRYDASGALLGSGFQVSTFTAVYAGSLGDPSVATDAAGNLIFVWRSCLQDGDLCGVFGQLFDASGARRGSEFQVNTFTTGNQGDPSVASDAAGNFVVAWRSYGQDGSDFGVFAQRYAASGAARGAEFRVNTYTTGAQGYGGELQVASDATGDFVVVWSSLGDSMAVFGQRYDAAGTKQGAEFRVDANTTNSQWAPQVAVDAAGDFVVAWEGTGHGYTDIFGQRFGASGVRRGSVFRVNSYTTQPQSRPAIASDAVGNLVVTWSGYGLDGRYTDIYAQRYGGLQPVALAVSPIAGGNNGVLEPNETVSFMPSWKNVSGGERTFGGAADLAGPPATGVTYTLIYPTTGYGAVADGATATCTGDCWLVELAWTGTRPATHWDATLTESITPDALGQTKPWSLHVGRSFTDVPTTAGYYRFVETLLHKGVASGCTATTYCPATSTPRGQMAVFALVGKEGSGYSPAACGASPMFTDVPVTSPLCSWIEEVARRGIAGGCTASTYCPSAVVTRGQMPIFMLKSLDPAIDPPACGTPMFGDVPAASPLCRWIEELARRGVVGGCGGGNYCPASPVTRGQMAVFISATFGLTLYGL